MKNIKNYFHENFNTVHNKKKKKKKKKRERVIFKFTND
jgi:hypothetical protein